jgi:diguanylate cyclase (GGDEF)-like protein/PAS domain S-box-containing protein
MHAPEILISAALIVFAIVVAAALVAVCIVVAGSFVSITTALAPDRAPRFIPFGGRRRRAEPPDRKDETEEEEEPVERAAPREPQIDILASDIVSNAAEGIVVYDRKLRCIVWNRFMEELTGIGAAEVLGKPATDLFPNSEYGIEDILARALSGETVSVPESFFSFGGSEQRQGWVTASFRPQRDLAGTITGVIGHVRDLTERKRAEQQIEYQAYHDALTGLANRRLFQEHLTLALALAQRKTGLLAVLFLDLDHFKVINDSLGHTIGDALLRVVAMRLKTHVREGDVIARVGGDEFTVVLQDLKKKEDIPAIAQKVLRAIAEPIDVDGHRLYVTASIGIAVYPDDGLDAETLLKNADNAMYRSKSEGRNTYQMSTEEMSRTMNERLTLEGALHQAIERSEFEVYYQPQIDITNMKVVGMEALLRWRHPERGILSPGSFLSVAEERGFIVLIGDWVLRQACAQAKMFRQAGLPEFRVAVNLSPRQFREQTLVESIESALKETGLDPHCLELEITESVAMENVDLTVNQLNRLRKIGISIAIDDFGMGHSSLSYLKKFPIDALKIDRGFVEDLPERVEDAAIVRSVIELAQGLNLRVVAEGVETKQQLDFLRQQNCREVQGFYFGFPVPPHEFQKMISADGRSH